MVFAQRSRDSLVRAPASSNTIKKAAKRNNDGGAPPRSAPTPLPARAPQARPHVPKPEPHTGGPAVLHSPTSPSTNMHGRPEAQHFHSAFPCCTTSTCTPQPPPSPPHRPTSHASSTHTPRPQSGPHRMRHANTTPSRPDRHTIPTQVHLPTTQHLSAAPTALLSHRTHTETPHPHCPARLAARSQPNTRNTAPHTANEQHTRTAMHCSQHASTSTAIPASEPPRPAHRSLDLRSKPANKANKSRSTSPYPPTPHAHAESDCYAPISATTEQSEHVKHHQQSQNVRMQYDICTSKLCEM